MKTKNLHYNLSQEEEGPCIVCGQYKTLSSWGISGIEDKYSNFMCLSCATKLLYDRKKWKRVWKEAGKNARKKRAQYKNKSTRAFIARLSVFKEVS